MTVKCPKCSSAAVETFQRGDYVTGTRCLACNYQTIARVCRTVEEIRAFIEGIHGDAQVLFQDEATWPRFEAHFTDDISKTDRIKLWRGAAKE